MDVKGKIAVVTGGGRGIGLALCQALQRSDAAAVVAIDLPDAFDVETQPDRPLAPSGPRVPAATGAAEDQPPQIIQLAADVTDELALRDAICRIEREVGPIDIYCSNAGICQVGSCQSPNQRWQQMWEVNLMAHVYAARQLIPAMVQRGGGYFLLTVSAAGLLTQIGSAPYSVTKHAAMGLAEWLAITYQRQGVRVSALCPQGVQTAMLEAAGGTLGQLLKDSALPPEFVAQMALDAIAEERFLVLPHPEVATYFQNKANDYHRWLRGMRRLWEQAVPDNDEFFAEAGELA
jgi:NAD(P)-dependent dehydrogenase (short-subunit alcohol dehydrogenase family)